MGEFALSCNCKGFLILLPSLGMVLGMPRFRHRYLGVDTISIDIQVVISDARVPYGWALTSDCLQ